MAAIPNQYSKAGPRRRKQSNAGIYFIVAVVLIGVALLLRYGCSRSPQISITWVSPKPGLEKGIPLRYESINIGKAVAVNSDPSGTTVRARLERKTSHYVRTKSTFLFHPASAGNTPFIEVIALDKDAPPALPGAQFTGSETAAEVGFKMITADWKRTALFCAVGLGLLLVLVLIVKAMFKLWAVILSFAGGAMASIYGSPLLEGHLRQFLPAEVRSDIVTYVIAFLLGSLLTSMVIGIVFKPMRDKKIA
jgi:hypothetical protein